MTLANPKNAEFVKLTDYLYLEIAGNKDYLWHSALTIFRELKWHIRKYNYEITEANSSAICCQVTGIASVYAKMIHQFWNDPSDYKRLAEKIVTKKINDTKVANQKMEDKEKQKTYNNINKKSKAKTKTKIKAPKKNKNKEVKKVKKKKKVVILSKEDKRKQKEKRQQLAKIKLFKNG
eukprot:427438_1